MFIGVEHILLFKKIGFWVEIRSIYWWRSMECLVL